MKRRQRNSAVFLDQQKCAEFFLKKIDWFVFFLKIETHRKKYFVLVLLLGSCQGWPRCVVLPFWRPFGLLRFEQNLFSVRNNFFLSFAFFPAFFPRLQRFYEYKLCCCFRCLFSCVGFWSAVLPVLRFFSPLPLSCAWIHLERVSPWCSVFSLVL